MSQFGRVCSFRSIHKRRPMSNLTQCSNSQLVVGGLMSARCFKTTVLPWIILAISLQSWLFLSMYSNQGCCDFSWLMVGISFFRWSYYLKQLIAISLSKLPYILSTIISCYDLYLFMLSWRFFSNLLDFSRDRNSSDGAFRVTSRSYKASVVNSECFWRVLVKIIYAWYFLNREAKSAQCSIQNSRSYNYTHFSIFKDEMRRKNSLSSENPTASSPTVLMNIVFFSIFFK